MSDELVSRIVSYISECHCALYHTRSTRHSTVADELCANHELVESCTKSDFRPQTPVYSDPFSVRIRTFVVKTLITLVVKKLEMTGRKEEKKI